MTLGAGFCAAGTSPAGFGDVDTAAAPNSALYVDQFGIKRNAARIDPSTQNFVLDSTGAVQGMSYVAQEVYLIVKTVLGTSAASATLGLPQSRRVVTSSLPGALERDLRNALQPLVSKNLMQIVSISVQMNSNTMSYGSLRWRDLSTGPNAPEQALALQ